MKALERLEKLEDIALRIAAVVGLLMIGASFAALEVLCSTSWS